LNVPGSDVSLLFAQERRDFSIGKLIDDFEPKESHQQ
jgi:hypothetical protein